MQETKKDKKKTVSRRKWVREKVTRMKERYIKNE